MIYPRLGENHHEDRKQQQLALTQGGGVVVCTIHQSRHVSAQEQGNYPGPSASWTPPVKSENVSHSVRSDSLRPLACSLRGSSVHGISQARILEWIAVSFSRGSSVVCKHSSFSSRRHGHLVAWTYDYKSEHKCWFSFS